MKSIDALAALWAPAKVDKCSALAALCYEQTATAQQTPGILILTDLWILGTQIPGRRPARRHGSRRPPGDIPSRLE